ncbi:hypothetical protein LVJ82_01350 [Vitreoscilla massiliensis]|uniref:Lipoprotein n=1 Tax=Vitreoscilla massiliensis TaxID=1689272 RepID=A0ABY4E2S0_9NEIS|nr:hypothetical protein [Vitreoscilla massiliensis]UOO89661.1 hypothetical protein LVJ82_01350 [Vitreoscilla massiliensis]
MYTRRQILLWGMAGVAMTQAGCITPTHQDTSPQATSRKQLFDVGGGMKIYRNEAVLALLTPQLHLLFKQVSNAGLDIRRLPLSLLNKAHAQLMPISLESRNEGKTAFGNAQAIKLYWLAQQLSAAETAWLEQTLRLRPQGVRAQHGLQQQGIAPVGAPFYSSYVPLDHDTNNVFFPKQPAPQQFYADAMPSSAVSQVWLVHALNDVWAQRQDALFAAAASPLQIDAQGTVHYQGQVLTRLDTQLQWLRAAE